MLNFPVSQSKVKDLRDRMQALGIVEGELTEHFFSPNQGRLRKSKAAVAVLLRHTPSGREIRCDSTTNQRLNRFIARRSLVKAMEEENEDSDKAASAPSSGERPDQHMARMFTKSFERDIAQPYPASSQKLLGDGGVPRVLIGILGEPNGKRRDTRKG